MIRLVVALFSEARPLIARFGLKPAAEAEGFRVFRGGETALVVSGIGRIAAAAATAYLHGLLGGGRNRPWINIGIGGHRSHPVGDRFLAHKIVDAGSGRCWYPPMIMRSPCATGELLTVDTPEGEYRRPVIYEMEAAGFYATACRFSTAELVHCVKIISDNRESPTAQLTPGKVEALVAGALDTVESVIEQTHALARELNILEAEPASLRPALDRWHFSVSEGHRLRGVLKRYQLLYPGDDHWLGRFDGQRGRDVLRWLEARIAAAPVRFD